MSGEGNLAKGEALLKVFNASGAGNLKLAYGTETGAATATVATGLSTVVCTIACMAGDPVDTCQHVTAELSSTAGAIDLSMWKMTASGNATLVASTTPFVDVFWIAIGR